MVDATSAPVPSAAVSILDARRIAIAAASTDAGGAFNIRDVPAGQYMLRVVASGFEAQWLPMEVRRNQQRSERIVLRIAAIREEVTVTPVCGGVLARSLPQIGERIRWPRIDANKRKCKFEFIRVHSWPSENLVQHQLHGRLPNALSR